MLSPYQNIFSGTSISELFCQTLENFIAQFGCQIPARVENVHTHQTGETGTVDVQPLINLQAEDGTEFERPLLYNIPYFRLQGGDTALIIDPKKNDIGQLILNGRDISAMSTSPKNTGKPASFRLFDQNDCFFLPALFGNEAKQYIFASDEGWKIHAKDNAKIILEAKNIMISGDLTIKGNVTIDGDLLVKGKITTEQDIIAGEKQISVQNHAHPVTTAPGLTGTPQ